MPALCWAGVLLLCAACSNGRGSVHEQAQQPPADAQPGFSVGGIVTGLIGSGLVLQNNGTGDLSIAADGSFSFAGMLGNGATYSVTVLSQPSGPAQICTVANGSGAIAGGPVTNVVVTCAASAFPVGGTVTGLAGSGLILQINGGDDLAIGANGTFTFPQPIPTGSTYDVTVRAQPTHPSQVCTVRNGSGTMDDAPVRNVSVRCDTGEFALRGGVSGLVGQGLVLQNNGADDLAISANGAFAFPSLLPSGAPYSITVRTQPSAPAQNCVVRNASGVINDRDVTNVAVSCATDTFTIGGTVSGLAGSGLVLQLNGTNDLPVSRSGRFDFPVGLADAATYSVSILRQPRSPAQSCIISNGSGVVAASNVGNIAVTCVTNHFGVGGTVSGLAGTGLALQLNGRDDLPIASNGSFTFPTRLASGTTYRVTIGMQPSSPPQNCTIQNATGTIGDGDVTNVRVTCATSTFSVGGAVDGLIGSGLVLQNNGGDPLEIGSNGRFTFERRLASGATYDVRVRSEPADPPQACTVANGAGIIASADVTNVSVSCTTSDFTIGGSVLGLASDGLVLQNNGGDDLAIDRSGNFTFPTALPAGASYQVTIAAQPATQTCTIDNASGVVNGRVTNVQVDCATPARTFRILVRVQHLKGARLLLQNNGGDDLAIASNGEFAFATPLPSGAGFNVTIARLPVNPAQRCTVERGSGTVGDSDVDEPRVECEKPDKDEDEDEDD